MKHILKGKVKTIRFLGTVILFIARTFEFLSTMLRFMVLASIVVGLFVGCFIGTMDLIYPTEYMNIPLWANILAVVVGSGCIWLASDKLKAEDRTYKEKMNALRNNTWHNE